MLEVLADELERMSDPRLELVTLTGVDVSRDLRHAKVYYSTLDRDRGRRAATSVPERRRDRAARPRARISAASSGARCASVRCRSSRSRSTRRSSPGQRIEEILREIHHRRGVDRRRAMTRRGRAEEDS